MRIEAQIAVFNDFSNNFNKFLNRLLLEILTRWTK